MVIQNMVARNLFGNLLIPAGKAQCFSFGMRGRFWEQIGAVENKLIKCVAIEDISSKFMLKNRKLARVASDAAWFQFSTILEYELFKYQRESPQRVSPRNTTQKCSNCGTLVPKDLSIRVHVCPCCGFVCDRDVNAGCNVVDGMSDELKSRYTLLKYNTATGLAEIHACGDMNLCVNDTHVDASSVAEAGSPRL